MRKMMRDKERWKDEMQKIIVPWNGSGAGVHGTARNDDVCAGKPEDGGKRGSCGYCRRGLEIWGNGKRHDGDYGIYRE